MASLFDFFVFPMCGTVIDRAKRQHTYLQHGKEKFIDRLASSQAFRMTYIGVPLVAGGLLVKS